VTNSIPGRGRVVSAVDSDWLAAHDAALRQDERGKQILRDIALVEKVADRRLIGRYMDEALDALRAQLSEPEERPSG
jgi:hypothetical protein